MTESHIIGSSAARQTRMNLTLGGSIVLAEPWQPIVQQILSGTGNSWKRCFLSFWIRRKESYRREEQRSHATWLVFVSFLSRMEAGRHVRELTPFV